MVKYNIDWQIDWGIRHMSRTEQKEVTRRRILEAAGRGFRKGGFGGVGVDGLAREAGVTSGAFYVHFDSKATAFRQAVVEGVSDVVNALHALQTERPDEWWPAFVAFYVGERRKCDLAESCGLQSLAPEVARADAESRSVFEAELRKVASAIASGPPCVDAPTTIDGAYAALAALIGAVTLARAVPDSALADQIAAATRRQLNPSCAEAEVKRKGRASSARAPR